MRIESGEPKIESTAHPAAGWTLSTQTALFIASAAAAAGCLWLLARSTPPRIAIAASVCTGIALAGLLALGSDGRLERLQQALTRKPVRIFGVVGALWAVYFAYAIAAGAARFTSLLIVAAYFSVPFPLLAKARGATRATVADALSILWLWLPVELGILRRLIITSAPNADLHYALMQALAVNLGLAAFAGWRRLPGMGYRFEFDGRIAAAALQWFGSFAAVAIPLGLAIHFIQYTFHVSKLLYAPAAFLGIFIFTAVPEELLFRGIIQNCIERAAGRGVVSLVVAAIVFGASHLNNGPPVPNYKYFLMASIAGVFYGLAWRRTGSLTASAITHALVDTAWSVFFR